MTIKISQVDFSSPDQGLDLVFLLNSYALDPMGGGKRISDYVHDNLISTLAARQDALSFIAYLNGRPVGFANCFEGFSTFACKPILNIHDIAVLPECRGQGIGRLILEAIESEARDRGCCKLSLEVLEGNKAAQQAYKTFGFGAYSLDPELGSALFWQKTL
jgi:GNAT superfamily N-acetyltransferase